MWLEEEEEEEEMPVEQVRRMGRRAGYTVGKQKTKGMQKVGKCQEDRKMGNAGSRRMTLERGKEFLSG